MTNYTLGLDAKSVDIALIIESSYPYILGGVSTWVEQILLGFPQYQFALIFLGGAPENYLEGIRYKIPENVTHFQTLYLFDEDTPPAFARETNYSENLPGMEVIRGVHEAFCSRQKDTMNEIGNLKLYKRDTGVDYDQFLYSEASWNMLTDIYNKNCGDISFIDYFWTIRNIHKPLWKLADMVETFPRARLIHTASTGYAGLLSFLIHQHYKYPVVLSEHGIYTRERRIDVFLSNDFRDNFDIDRPLSDLSYLRNLWDRYFKTIAQLCYNVANPIISLSSTAHEVQIEEGAEAKKTQVIPNGVDIDRFLKLRRPFSEREPIVCFVGRIVPMKDVKGFIRAIPIVHKKIPDSKFWIIGSIDQDPDYAKECHELAENLDLQNVIDFKLHQNMNDVLPKIRIIVLSAIREGMPFIILEAFAAGVPVVTTDVGACKEMVLGLSEEDKALGPAGIVVKVADTNALQAAISQLLNNKETWEAMSLSAIQRAKRYYDQKSMISDYEQIYLERML